ncbi:hypothetical protein E1292_48870 [Nonomuraea deserti]|uniref:Uncharacterized protein n=1 Tax=Nonomuraea deserti TaxID=1848322 RepID=A0A4R4UAJ5_9ACTN|nr:hypothetical protein [Nonomuraea deserti]TDC85392.1 hypothetical protein E1292_48870 [Nonomuraea deserti]
MAEVNAKMLAQDGQRAPSVLAARIATLAGEFDAIASRSQAATVDWLQGTPCRRRRWRVTCSRNA